MRDLGFGVGMGVLHALSHWALGWLRHVFTLLDAPRHEVCSPALHRAWGRGNVKCMTGWAPGGCGTHLRRAPLHEVCNPA